MSIKLEGNGVNYTFPNKFDIVGYSRTFNVKGQKIEGRDGEVTDDKSIARNPLNIEVRGVVKSNSIASAYETYNEITNAINGLPDEVYLVNTDDAIRIPVRCMNFVHERQPAMTMDYSVRFKAANPYWESRTWSEVEFSNQKIVDVNIGNAPLYPKLILDGLATNPTIVAGNWSFNSHIGNLKAKAITNKAVAGTDPYGDITGQFTESDIALGEFHLAATTLSGAYGLDISGTTLYVCSADILSISALSHATQPTILWAKYASNFLEGARQVKVNSAGSIVYITAETDDCLVAYETGTPTILGTAVDAVYLNGAWGLALTTNYAYVAARSANLLTSVRVAAPSTLSVIGWCGSAGTLGDPRGVVKKGNYLYVTSNDLHRVVVVDVSTGSTPTTVNHVQDTTHLNGAMGIAKSGNHLLVASNATHRIAVVDITAPTTPIVRGSVKSVASLKNPRFVAPVGNKYALAGGNGSDSVGLIDYSSPATPILLRTLISSASMNGTSEVIVSGDTGYVVGYDSNSVGKINLNGTSTANDSIKASKYGYGRLIEYRNKLNLSSLQQRWDKFGFNYKAKPRWPSTGNSTRYLFDFEKDGATGHWNAYVQDGRLMFGAGSTFGGAINAFSKDDNVEFSGWYDNEGTTIDGTKYYGKLFQGGAEIASTTATLDSALGTLDKLHVGTNTKQEMDYNFFGVVDELYFYNQPMGDNYCKGETKADRALNPDNITLKWTSSVSTNDLLTIDNENANITEFDVSAVSTSNEMGSMDGRFFRLGVGAARTGHDKNKIDTITFGTAISGKVQYRRLYW